MRLLHQREAEARERRERDRISARARLREILSRYLTGREIYLFGSITRPGAFHGKSDVDLALTALPSGRTQYGLIALLEEELRRPVDLLLLPETRLREKIEREGEKWTV